MKKSLARKNSPHPMMGRARSGSSNWIHLLTRSSQSTYLWVSLSCVYCTYVCQFRPVICRQKDFWILLRLVSSYTYFLWKEVLPEKLKASVPNAGQSKKSIKQLDPPAHQKQFGQPIHLTLGLFIMRVLYICMSVSSCHLKAKRLLDTSPSRLFTHLLLMERSLTKEKSSAFANHAGKSQKWIKQLEPLTSQRWIGKLDLPFFEPIISPNETR